jgi:hypothetical protein
MRARLCTQATPNVSARGNEKHGNTTHHEYDQQRR